MQRRYWPISRSNFMAKLNLMAAALLTAAVPLVASCAPAGSGEPGAAALTPKQAERLDKQLAGKVPGEPMRSEEHTSELQSLMRISYAVFCLKKKKKRKKTHTNTRQTGLIH